MRQFYLEIDPDQPLHPGDTLTLDQEESHHLFTVLRGGRNSELELVDGRGHRLTGHLRGRDGKRAQVEILTVTTDEDEFREPRLVLACAVVKGKRFEWALEKAVELGAHEFLPLETHHGVVDPRPGKRDRWRTIMVAALKQSGRSWLPSLSYSLSLGEVLERNTTGQILFGAAPDDRLADAPPLSIPAILSEKFTGIPPATLSMLIGPEGGWTSSERGLMIDHGVRPVSLGRHVLRTETAAVCGLTVLQTLRDRWLDG